MKHLATIALVLLSIPVWAEVIPLDGQHHEKSQIIVKTMNADGTYRQEVQFNLKKVNATLNARMPKFTDLSEENVAFSQDVGTPSLPFKAILVAGQPSEINVVVDAGAGVTTSLLPTPSQPEDCRCETEKKDWVSYKMSKYDPSLYKVEYLGKYRGEALSRVTLFAAQADLTQGTTTFYPQLRAEISSEKSLGNMFKSSDVGDYDYLIVAPSSLLPGLVDFVTYKTHQGHKVQVVKLEDAGPDVAKLGAFFKSEYQAHKFKFALIVGTDDLVPNNKVRTSGSYATPSDYPYFLMDANDMIPDVHYGRIVASTVDEVSRQTKKWITYQDHGFEFSQYLKMIGIASNEGSNPSDNEYVKGMAADLKAGRQIESTHFYQNDATSRPNFINDAFNTGSSLLIYLGHGSGTSWGSTGTSYSVSNVKQINNPHVLQPVVIDVACQNGILKKGYFGETFLNGTNANGEAIGATMYYGGSVNISWHPPAIMARGLVKKTIANNLTVMGDALLAGHLYLLENYTDLESVRDNFEWYHLFGDPSSDFFLK